MQKIFVLLIFGFSIIIFIHSMLLIEINKRYNRLEKQLSKKQKSSKRQQSKKIRIRH